MAAQYHAHAMVHGAGPEYALENLRELDRPPGMIVLFVDALGLGLGEVIRLLDEAAVPDFVSAFHVDIQGWIEAVLQQSGQMLHVIRGRGYRDIDPGVPLG